jgi:hypothetical protein
MGTKTKKFGKVVKDHKGYKVRLMLKSAGKTEVTGKFGVYAGKNKITELDTLELAVSHIEDILAKK